MLKSIYIFFDKLEDRVRGKLSRQPIMYAFIGGVGIVLFWRGVWHLADAIMFRYFKVVDFDGITSMYSLPWWDGLLSLGVGSGLLLLSGIFVSNFIGNEIIISGVRGEKKVVDKTKKEIFREMNELVQIEHDVKKISRQIGGLKRKN